MQENRTLSNNLSWRWHVALSCMSLLDENEKYWIGLDKMSLSLPPRTDSYSLGCVASCLLRTGVVAILNHIDFYFSFALLADNPFAGAIPCITDNMCLFQNSMGFSLGFDIFNNMYIVSTLYLIVSLCMAWCDRMFHISYMSNTIYIALTINS